MQTHFLLIICEQPQPNHCGTCNRSLKCNNLNINQISMFAEWNVVFSKNVLILVSSLLICYGDYKVTSEKAVKHIFMSNNYSNDTDSG